MDAMTFIKETSIDEARRIAEVAGTTYNYFYQIARGDRNASTKLAKKLVAASGGRLDLMSLMTATESKADSAA